MANGQVAVEQVSIKSMKSQGGLTYDRGITERTETDGNQPKAREHLEKCWFPFSKRKENSPGRTL